MDAGEAGGANVGVLAFEAAAFEGEGVKGFFTGDADFGAGHLPFTSVRIDASSSGSLVSDEMGEFMFQGAP